MEQRAPDSQIRSGPLGRSRARRTVLIGAAVVALVAVAAGGYLVRGRGSDGPVAQPTPSATVGSSPRVAVVTYEITGKGRVDINYTDPARSSPVVLDSQALPWSVDLPRQPVEFVSVSATRKTYREVDKGDVHTTRILIDGMEICSNSNKYGFREARCMEPVPRV